MSHKHFVTDRQTDSMMTTANRIGWTVRSAKKGHISSITMFIQPTRIDVPAIFRAAEASLAKKISRQHPKKTDIMEFHSKLLCSTHPPNNQQETQTLGTSYRWTKWILFFSFNIQKNIFSLLAAVFCPKNLPTARKIVFCWTQGATPGGAAPSAPLLVRLCQHDVINKK